MTMIHRGVETAREEARQRLSGRFGVQAHQESGVVEPYGSGPRLVSRAEILDRMDWPASVRFVDAATGVCHTDVSMYWSKEGQYAPHVLIPILEPDAEGQPRLLDRDEVLSRTDWPASAQFVDARSGVSHSLVQMSYAAPGLFTAHALTPFTE